MTEEELQELEELAINASPGPWKSPKDSYQVPYDAKYNPLFKLYNVQEETEHRITQEIGIEA